MLAAMTGNPASIFVSGAFARERADGECKKLRKAGVIELIVGAVIIVAAYIITNLTLSSDAFRAVTDWLFLCLTLVTDMGLALIAVSTPKDKRKRRRKIKLCGIKFQARKTYRLSWIECTVSMTAASKRCII